MKKLYRFYTLCLLLLLCVSLFCVQAFAVEDTPRREATRSVT